MERRRQAAQITFGVCLALLPLIYWRAGWERLRQAGWAVAAALVILPALAAAAVQAWQEYQQQTPPEPEPATPEPGRLPRRVDRTPRPAGMVWHQLRFGVTVTGGAAVDLRITPHLLIVGETGSGKSRTIDTLIREALDAGFLAYLIDPKQFELNRWRHDPQVQTVAYEVPQMIETVEALWAEMDRRNGLLRENDWTPDEVPLDVFPPVLIVVDELHEFFDLVNQWWRRNREKGATGTTHPVVEKWESLVRLGRASRMHQIAGIQRPDAKIMEGAVRSNFGARIACGPMKDDTDARMVFGDSKAGRGVPHDVKGRATADVGNRVPTEVQVFLTEQPKALTHLAVKRGPAR